MPYHLDLASLGLDFLVKRLREEDLIPSLLPLRAGAADAADRFAAAGIADLGALASRLGKPATKAALALETGLPPAYLDLLSRAVRGWTPKPAPLADFPLLEADFVAALARRGIADGRRLWTEASRRKDRARLASDAGLDPGTLLRAASLADLGRVQWVSPSFACVLYAAGYASTGAVARSAARELAERAAAANAERKIHRGKVGERDMGRLAYLASLLPDELEA